MHPPAPTPRLTSLLGKPVTTIDFVLPNRRFETIRRGKAPPAKQRWFSSLTTVTPVTASPPAALMCMAAWNIGYWVPG